MTSADGAPAVALRGLGRAYGDRVALEGVTLELPRGATLAVFGANGAGKTTLLRVLATLLRPHRGEVAVLGRALPRDGWAVRGQIGLLAHDPLLYRDLSARENLRFHARLHDVEATPGGRAAGGGRDDAARRRAAALAVARDGPAGGDLPRRPAPARSCCCSTSRWRTSTPAPPTPSRR